MVGKVSPPTDTAAAEHADRARKSPA